VRNKSSFNRLIFWLPRPLEEFLVAPPPLLVIACLELCLCWSLLLYGAGYNVHAKQGPFAPSTAAGMLMASAIVRSHSAHAYR
jgi:hypothetical protein